MNELENMVTNDTKVSRRDALKNIAYGIGAALGITSLYACGGGSSDSGSSNNGNGNGGTEPTIDHAYIVSEFEKMGWDVYDAKTGSLDNEIPADPLRNTLMHDDFQVAYNSNKNNVQGVFSSEDNLLLRYAIDNDSNNDELFMSFVTDGNKFAMTLRSNDTNVGENGLYHVQKQLTQENADIVRGL